MSTSNPFADLSAHQELLKQLQEATAACLKVVREAEDALQEIANHNISGQSHPDLRRAVELSGTTVTESIYEQINTHDTSVSAHAALISNLKATLADTSSVRELINELLGTHNENDSSHPDMRATLNTLSASLGAIDLTSMVQELDRIVDQVDNVIADQIISLQTKDAYHDDLIAANTANIESLLEKVEEFNAQFVAVAREQMQYQEDLDRVDCEQYAIDMERKYGIPAQAANAPDLLTFSHTFPIYVGSNSTINFSMTGAKGSSSPTAVKYSIVCDRPNMTFSQTENISASQNIVLNTGNLGSIGTKLHFRVKITDTTTNKDTWVVIAGMVTKPVSTATLTMHGLPKMVEPGKTYTFEIRNVQDAGNGRLTYDIDANDSGLLFDVYQDLSNNATVNMTVPNTHARDTDYIFKVLVKDAYGISQEKAITVHTIPLPGAEDFTHNVPTIVVPGKTYHVAFRGIVDNSGRALNYDIVDANSFLEFSKSKNILPNENVAVTVNESARRGETLTFTVQTASLQAAAEGPEIESVIPGDVVAVPLACNVNRLPLADDVATTLENEINGGQHISFQISGGTDPDGEAGLTYSIDAGETGFVFSRVRNIKPTDTVYVQVPKVSMKSIKSFFVSVTDAQGETCVEPQQIDVIVNPIIGITTPSITYPLAGALIPVDFTMRFSECSTYVDMS